VCVCVYKCKGKSINLAKKKMMPAKRTGTLQMQQTDCSPQLPRLSSWVELVATLKLHVIQKTR